MSDVEADDTVITEVPPEKEMQSPKKDKVRRDEAERMVAAQEEEDDVDVPPAGEGLSDEVYEVAKILDHLYDDDGVLFFMVRWKGYGPDDDSLEPAENLTTASVAIADYWDRNKGKERKGPAKKNERTTKKSSATPQSSKKRTNKTKSESSTKKASSTSRTRGRKSTSIIDSAEAEPEPEKSPSPDDDSKDGSFQETSKKAKGTSSRTLSKGALKSYEDTPVKNSDPPPISSAKTAALKHRSTWLFDDDGSDDSDDDVPSESTSSKKKSGTKKTTAKAVDKEFAKDKEKEAMPVDNKNTLAETKKRKAESSAEAHNDMPSGSTSIKKIKVEMPSLQELNAMISAHPGVSSADEISDGPRVLGIHRRDSNSDIMVCIDGRTADPEVITLREAFGACGYGLVQYLVSRMEFH